MNHGFQFQSETNEFISFPEKLKHYDFGSLYSLSNTILYGKQHFCLAALVLNNLSLIPRWKLAIKKNKTFLRYLEIVHKREFIPCTSVLVQIKHKQLKTF